jgi:hypothetical protein
LSDNNAAAPAVVSIVDQTTQQMKVFMKAKDTTTSLGYQAILIC